MSPAEDDRTAAIIVAAGQGERLGADVPKQFVDIGGRPMLRWSVETLLTHPEIDHVVVVLPPDRLGAGAGWLAGEVTTVPGGVERSDSVRAGLAAVDAGVGTILVHDGARPFVSVELVSRVVAAARGGPAIPATPVEDTIKRVDAEGRIVQTVERADLFRAQTPQGFPAEALRRAHAAVGDGDAPTDDALLCERLGMTVTVVPGDPANRKITTRADLAWARWFVEGGLIREGS